MNDKFDELAKHMAQAVTRRQALRRFGVGVGAFLLAALALPRRANADAGDRDKDIVIGYCAIDTTSGTLTGFCFNCTQGIGGYNTPDCAAGASASKSAKCGIISLSSTRCKFGSFIPS